MGGEGRVKRLFTFAGSQRYSRALIPDSDNPHPKYSFKG
jgi:hypothetical protein